MQSPQARRREAMARLICAEKMRLRIDPLGEAIPESLWAQALERADAVLLLVGDVSAI